MPVIYNWWFATALLGYILPHLAITMYTILHRLHAFIHVIIKHVQLSMNQHQNIFFFRFEDMCSISFLHHSSVLHMAEKVKEIN